MLEWEGRGGLRLCLFVVLGLLARFNSESTQDYLIAAARIDFNTSYGVPGLLKPRVLQLVSKTNLTSTINRLQPRAALTKIVLSSCI